MRLSQFGQPRHTPRQRRIIGASLAVMALIIATAITAGILFGDDTTNGASVVGTASASVVARAPASESPAPPSESPAPRRFDTPQAIVTYLDSRGLTCSRYETVEGATSAVGRGRCYVGTEEVTVGVYAIRSDVEAQWNMMAGMLSGIASLHMALGDNWTVNGPAEWTKKVAGVMGVEYRQQVS